MTGPPQDWNAFEAQYACAEHGVTACNECLQQVAPLAGGTIPVGTELDNAPASVAPMLDLRDVEVRLTNIETASDLAAHAKGDALALLAYCRALRAALQEFVMRLNDSETQEDGTRRRVAGVYAERARFERAAAVLAQATDQVGA